MSEEIQMEKHKGYDEISNEFLTKCGDIFIGEDCENLLIFCTLCDEKCYSVEYFLSHFKATHLGLTQLKDYEELHEIIKEEKEVLV